MELLRNIDEYERSKLADTLKEEKYLQGEYIIKEGEEGHSLYIVLEGEVMATKKMENGNLNQLKKYSAGEYFGELSLLKNAPRAANIVAETSIAKVVCLDRKTFMRLLGPLDSIL